MKTSNKLLLFVIVVGATITSFNSCKEDPTYEREVVEIRDTLTIYIDTVYKFNDAEYVESTGNCDTNFYYPYALVIDNLLDTTVLIDSSSQLSIAYLGGYHNPEPEPEIDIIYVHPHYVLNGDYDYVFITDTVYEVDTIVHSYAILEISDGNSTIVDTAYYHKDKKVNDIEGRLIDDKVDYALEIDYIFSHHGYYEDDPSQFEEYLLNYHKLSTLKSGVDLYLINILTSEGLIDDHSQLTLFNKNLEF